MYDHKKKKNITRKVDQIKDTGVWREHYTSWPFHIQIMNDNYKSNLFVSEHSPKGPERENKQWRG
jgi:hypothetical protein